MTRHLRMLVPMGPSTRVEKFVRQWASMAASVYLRQLRHFTLRVGIRQHHFKFSVSRGLEVETWGAMADIITQIKDHVKAIEADRKVLGLQGEAIVMAIMRKPELW